MHFREIFIGYYYLLTQNPKNVGLGILEIFQYLPNSTIYTLRVSVGGGVASSLDDTLHHQQHPIALIMIEQWIETKIEHDGDNVQRDQHEPMVGIATDENGQVEDGELGVVREEEDDDQYQTSKEDQRDDHPEGDQCSRHWTTE